MKKLNLGCGMDYKEGFINIDNEPLCKPDLVHDLGKKLPFKTNSVDYILISHVLEHLDDHHFVIEEMYRVCKPNAIIDIRLPHFASAGAFAAHHKRFFSTICLREYLVDTEPRIHWKTWSTGFVKPYFKLLNLEITFCSGLNPLNYFGRLFNLSRRLQLTYENTLFRNIFISNNLLFKLGVIKKPKIST